MTATMPREDTTVVSHLAFEVPKQLLGWEKAFWEALGFGRRTRPEPKPSGWWLNGGGIYVHLQPVEVAMDLEAFRGRYAWTHVAIVPRYGLEAALDGLDRLPFRLIAEEAATHWGARRIFVTSPAGYRVELLAFEPPARWSGVPDDD